MRVSFELKFVDDARFQPSYIRNNPRKGIKHLRCFPACTPHGHRGSRFCGRPLDIEVRAIAEEQEDAESADIWTDDLEFIGEFVLESAERPERLAVSQSWFEAQTHGPHNPSGSIYRGRVISSFRSGRRASYVGRSGELPAAAAAAAVAVKTLVVRFNDDADGAWQCGVRSSSRTRHCFRAAVLRRVPEIIATNEPAMTLEEIAALTSPSFRIVSARRLNSQLLQLDGPRLRALESKSEPSSKQAESSDDEADEEDESRSR